MSTTITSPRGAAAPEPRIEGLRCPGEQAALALCIASNFVVLALAVAIVLAGSEWLATHPVLDRNINWIRGILLAAIIAVPAAPIGRHLHVHAARTGGVRVSANQLPELHERLVRACRMLGVDRVPELYLSRDVEGPAAAYCVWGGSVIVLDADLIPEDEDWTSALDWLTFVMAGALGSIRLHHTRWWVEVLTVYARRIPGLRVPLLVKWTHSRDRCGAFVVPDGIRGLLVEAVGKDAVGKVDIAAFVAQAEIASSFWTSLAAIHRQRPLLAARARALYDAGFFDRARDLKRGSSLRPA